MSKLHEYANDWIAFDENSYPKTMALWCIQKLNTDYNNGDFVVEGTMLEREKGWGYALVTKQCNHYGHTYLGTISIAANEIAYAAWKPIPVSNIPPSFAERELYVKSRQPETTDGQAHN